jgi:CheY-like chemotaxis protein
MAEKKKFSILIGEDNPDDYFLMQLAIHEENEAINIYHAFNGKQLLEFIEKEDVYKKISGHDTPDLIITDLQMPFMNGLDVIKKIKDMKNMEGVPIYIFSNNDSETVRDKANKSGATRFYRKPHTFLDLKELVREILRENKL